MDNTTTPETPKPGQFAGAHGSARRPKVKGWWEEYRCGCVSETVARKKDLVGYCGAHGENRRQVFPEIETMKAPNVKVSDRATP